MAIQLHTITSNAEYQLSLYNFLVKVEGKRYDAYVIANLKTVKKGSVPLNPQIK